MKKIRFLKPCHDKYTGEEYLPGKIKTIKNARADEIVKAGYAEIIEEKKKWFRSEKHLMVYRLSVTLSMVNQAAT